ASPRDIGSYVARKFSVPTVAHELRDERNVFHLLYEEGELAGYSKIIPDSPHPKIQAQNVTKLERLYLRRNFHDRKLGYRLFEFNVELARKMDQTGFWLFVWVGNQRAMKFYERLGFKVIGQTMFQISDTHANPNYWMYYEFV